MALPAGTVWEVRPGGNDANGGGFVTGTVGGTDWSVQDASHGNGTNLTVDASTNTKVNPDGYTVASTDVGNIVHITTTGTGAAFTVGFYQITTATTGTSVTQRWTLDRSPAAVNSAGATWAMGGALLSPAIAALAASVPSNNIVYIYNAGGTIYSITSATTNIAGGTITNGQTLFVGYATNRTISNTDARPTIQLNVATATINQSSASNLATFRNIIFDGNLQTTSALTGNGNAVFRNCAINNFTSGSGVNGYAFFCTATGNTAAGAAFRGTAYFCVATANTAAPFNGVKGFYCISYSNTGATTDGFTGNLSHYVDCIAYNNGRHGFNGGTSTVMINCIATSNVGTGFNIGAQNSLRNCAYLSNGTNVSSIPVTSFTDSMVALTADPFVNAAAGNFALKIGPSRGAGYGTMPDGLTIGFPDIGAAQHKEPPRSIPSIGRSF